MSSETSKSEEYLTTPSLVSQYLSITPSVPQRYRNPTSVTKLSGGAGNFVFRLHLPEDGEGGSSRTAVLKHSAPFVATWPELEFEISRWDVERDCLRRLGHVATEHVRLPELLFDDGGRKVLIIEDAGKEAVSLKELLGREKAVPESLMRKVGDELGTFLAKLHTSTSTVTGGKREVKPEYKADFEGLAARKMCAWRTFGRLKSQVDKWTPAYEYPAPHTSEQLEALCERVQKGIMEDNQCITMGDFWTGNVLVRLTGDGELDAAFVVDWELAHPGDPAHDVAQMTAEMFCSRSFANDANASAADVLARTFHERYCREVGVEAGSGFRGDVMAYAGAHVATWMPNVGWSDDKEKVREVAGRSMEMLWEGYNGGENGGFCEGLAK